MQLTGERYDEHLGLLNSEAAWNTIRNLSLRLCRNCQLQGIKLLHSAAISKQIVKAPAIEVHVNDNSLRETGGFLPALKDIKGEREKIPPSGFVENYAVCSIQVNTSVISSETQF